MTYQPYLIASYPVGIDNAQQPWLSPDDSQETLFDGFVYRGQWEKRQGYEYFANGLRGGAPYTESRIVSTTTAEVVGAADGMTLVFNYTLANLPVARGTVTVSYTISGMVHTAIDDGVGGLSGFDVTPSPASTINYTTGALQITFTVAPDNMTNVTVTYSSYPGLPVMMVANFYTDADNTRQLIVADTRNINRYNPTTNRLNDITSGQTFTGGPGNFFSWLNYQDANSKNRLLFVNNKDPIQVYDGTTVANYSYTLTGVTALSCLLMFQLKDRLILLRTIETTMMGTTVFPRRIRISGTGSNSDVFDPTATGAGVIDIPSNTWIMGADFNRDDLLIFTENSIWSLKYTGNDTTPFVLNRLDESRGSQAPYASITYLSRTQVVSRRGFVITDGYTTQRMDDKIPAYSYNNIAQDDASFQLCFSGTIDEDRDNYLIHPSPGQTASDRILITNYEEDTFAVYRFGLSCMGSFQSKFTTTWNDLTDQFQNWTQFGNAYDSWNQFGFTEGTPLAIGGGHKGEIWKINLDTGEDNPTYIYNVTIINSTVIEVTTDWSNYSDYLNANSEAPYIFLSGIVGLTNVNNRQFQMISKSDNYTFRLQTLQAEPVTGNYVSGGRAVRVIPFESKTKKFNPFAQSDKKVRCGWLYFYMDTSDTDLLQVDPNTGEEVPVPAKLTIEVITNDTEQATKVFNFNFSPYQPNASNLPTEIGIKKWNKIWINQTARFIQFNIKNTQAGSKIKIQAMMPGFAPVGRMV